MYDVFWLSNILRTTDRGDFEVCSMEILMTCFFDENWKIKVFSSYHGHLFWFWRPFLTIFNYFRKAHLKLVKIMKILTKNRKVQITPARVGGSLQWLGRVKIIVFERIWSNITICFVWKSAIFDIFLLFFWLLS